MKWHLFIKYVLERVSCMLKKMNEALDYIEANLLDEINDHEIEKIVATSAYHFKRMFSYLSGMTISEYVRNRKLSHATFDLREGKSVTETAFKYGYDSVDGFSRAFKEWAGINPSEVKGSKQLKSFPKLSFQLTIQGGINMEYRIEEKEAFKIVGVSKRVPIQFEGENTAIIEVAKSITSEQREKLRQLANVEPHQVVNASYDFSTGRMEEKGELTHMIGVLTTEESDFKGFDHIAVPQLTWAIFSSKGKFPERMQETWGKIFSEWLPSSNYELVKAPEISFISDLEDKNNVYSEIWIAIMKKAQ